MNTGPFIGVYAWNDLIKSLVVCIYYFYETYCSKYLSADYNNTAHIWWDITELTLCPSWHELPKSTILIADLLGLHKRIFSGLRSQWIMLSSGVDRNSKAVHSCCANLRVRFRETPRKLVLRSKSYRLYDSSSKTRHRWLRHMKCRFSFTTTQNNRFIHCSW